MSARLKIRSKSVPVAVDPVIVLFIDPDILFINNGGFMKMLGERLRDTLSNDLGFEADRARELPLSKASEEISIYWEKKKFPEISPESCKALAKASMLAGVAGLQKTENTIQKVCLELSANQDIQEVARDISALAKKHQATLNLSRHRTTCVNAHLNILDPDKTLARIYSTFVSAPELKKFKERSSLLLKASVSSETDLNVWITQVHKLLEDISAAAQGNSQIDDESDELDLDRSKGIISSKALPTYLSQWKMFVREKIGPLFGIVLTDDDCSPLVQKLKELEKENNRSWTTIVNDITEIRTSTSFQKRLNSQTRTVSPARDLISETIPLKGKICTIQRSLNDFDQQLVNQFIKSMKAQLFIYSGTGIFTASLRLGNGMITAELPNATKSDIGKIEDYLNCLV